MFDDEGRQAFVPLPGLVNEFWKVGEENLRLIQDGKKDEAFAFLVDRAIPARNKILAVLDGEKKRQSQRLSLTINEVKSLAAADRNIAVAVMVLVVACLSGLGLYLRAVVRDLGADPPDLKRVAPAKTTASDDNWESFWRFAEVTRPLQSGLKGAVAGSAHVESA